MSYYTPKKVDSNQPELVKLLRQLGFSVLHLHEVGKGCFDLLVAKHGVNVLCEVKDGNKYPSQRRFTPQQEEFNFHWQGMRCVITCPSDCAKLSRYITEICIKLNMQPNDFYGFASEEEIYLPKLT